MQRKRPRLVNHRLFPVVFLTLMILIVIAGAIFILGPALASQFQHTPYPL